MQWLLPFHMPSRFCICNFFSRPVIAFFILWYESIDNSFHFGQFMENQGVLFNVTFQNHIEVSAWNVLKDILFYFLIADLNSLGVG